MCINNAHFCCSWHEIGYYDLPAMIDYVLKTTGHSQLYYIGHSQGTTAFYVMGSERPEYNAKVKIMISLAPIAFLSNQRSPLLKFIVHFNSLMEVILLQSLLGSFLLIRHILFTMKMFQWGSHICNIHEWFPRTKWQTRIMSTIMRNAPGMVAKGLCSCWFYLIAGFGSDQLDKSMLPLIFGHFPAGTSTKQLIHYSQIIISSK